MKDTTREQWTSLHKEGRFRPKYPSEQVVQYVFRHFERNGKTKVLDLGCGAGRHVMFMANENIIPYGLDFSETGISYTKDLLSARGYADYVSNMQVGSLTDLPFETQMFDGIICYGTLYYMNRSDIEMAVKEMLRVLKVGGKVMVVVRTTKDYRYLPQYKINDDEPNTIIVNETDASKCAHNESGMIMHFFEREELSELFQDFSDVVIDEITETHDNGKFCDSNFILSAARGGI